MSGVFPIVRTKGVGQLIPWMIPVTFDMPAINPVEAAARPVKYVTQLRQWLLRLARAGVSRLEVCGGVVEDNIKTNIITRDRAEILTILEY